MKILIINNKTKNINELKYLFKDHNIDICSLGNNFDENGYDLYVLSGGSHHSVFFEPSPYQKEIDFIKKTNKNVSGICLGSKIVAKTYGSIIDVLPQKLEGMIEIEYKGKNYKVFESHRFAIKTLGKELCGLVKSNYGYEIIKHRSKSIWGIQFCLEKNMDKVCE